MHVIGSKVKKNCISLIICMALASTTITGCAVTAGLQAYDLPQNGEYQTDLGTTVQVLPITQSIVEQISSKDNTKNNTISHLFNQKKPFYLLNAGDILSINLWAYPEIIPTSNSGITNTQSAQASGFRIDQQGNVLFPLIGTIRAQGKTVQQFTQELQNKLSKYLKHPDALVRVISYESKNFSLVGNVAKSGQYYLSDQPTSLYAALGLAGGVNLAGDNTAIQLVRQGITYDINILELEKTGYSLHQLLIEPNDTIYVGTKESQKVYVMGESGKNQALIMREKGMTLSDVLGESLGINPLSASAGRIYVLRSKDQKTSVYHLNLTNLADFGLASQFSIRSNDIIYVDATGLTRWQRIINQMLPFSSALYNMDRLGN